ncbi:MAG: TRAP transporter small permease subunit [Hyphomicrobiales bacterium]|nr:TRAP transporter small permease subunit [Hyphomicrobiales bacterium]
MERVWTSLERVLGLMTLVALASLIVLPVGQVVLREFFSRPIVGLEEFTRWGLICTVFLGMPLLVRANEHIRLSEFVDKLPVFARRLLERVILMTGGGALVIVAIVGYRSAMANVGTRTPTIDIPFWLFASPMILGLGLSGLGLLWLALRRAPPPTNPIPPIL